MRTGPLLEFGVALLGLWFLVEAVSTGLQVEATLFTTLKSRTEYLGGNDLLTGLASAEAWMARIPHLARAVCGMGLVIWAAGVVGVWERMRTAGHARQRL